jgi:hypothetical protein
MDVDEASYPGQLSDFHFCNLACSKNIANSPCIIKPDSDLAI